MLKRRDSEIKIPIEEAYFLSATIQNSLIIFVLKELGVDDEHDVITGYSVQVDTGEVSDEVLATSREEGKRRMRKIAEWLVKQGYDKSTVDDFIKDSTANVEFAVDFADPRFVNGKRKKQRFRRMRSAS